MIVEKGLYKDYKGDIYEVISTTKLDGEDEEIILYKKNGNSTIHAMPIAMWDSLVSFNRKYIHRFTSIDKQDNNDIGSISPHPNIDLKHIYRIISNYLFEIKPSSISKEQLKEYYVSEYPKDLKTLAYEFFGHIQNYQFMPNVIGFWNEQRVPIFKRVLFDYDTNKILSTYTKDSLFKEFCNKFPVKNKNSKQNSWLKYAGGIISVCEYMKKFNTIDEYIEYCNQFNGSLELPLEISKKIKGMGFALACDHLKENGCKEYCKPDVHLKDVLSEIGLCSREDYDVFETIKRIAQENNVTPYDVDKTIWLICSGNYYKHNIIVESHKQDLINRIKKGIINV